MNRTRSATRPIICLGILCAVFLLPVPLVLAAPPVAVNEADPSSAEQGTVNLDVTITGRGFDNSAVARFFVTGSTNPGGVTVNSTTFVNNKKLVANIDIDDLAVVDDFDIEVELLSSGRKGKGTERFSVLQRGSGGNGEVELCVTFRNGVGDLLRSDLLSDTYCHGEEAHLIARIGNLLGKFNLFLSQSGRAAVLEFPDCDRLIPGGDCSTAADFVTIDEWEYQGSWLMPTGSPLDLRALGENGSPSTAYVDFQVAFPSASKSTPHLIVFGSSNRYLCGDPVLVTRLDQDTWEIEATNQTACLVEVFKKGNRRVVHDPFPSLPFKITLRRQ